MSGMPKSPAEPMHKARPDPHHPDLRIWQTCQQSISRRQFVLVDFVYTGVNIDGNELAFVFSATDWAARRSRR
jgi:hypothetical protein